MALVKPRTSPGMANSKASKSLLGSFCQGDEDTTLQVPKRDGVIFFSATADLKVALCDLQDEASGGFRKPCCTGEAQLSLSNPG